MRELQRRWGGPRATRGRTPLVAVVVLAVAAGWTGCAREAAADREEWRGRLLEAPVERPDFTLMDTEGQPFDFHAATAGRLTFLFFGYTNCPDVCPVHMANLGAVLARLPFEERRRIDVVFVTTDPARDTPARMREWLDRFDRRFIGLYGDTAEVNRIQAALGVAPARPGDPRPDGSYDVGHAAQVIAFTPDDRAHIVYPFGTRQEDWIRDIPRLLDASW